MASICFHTLDSDAQLKASERRALQRLCVELFLGKLDLSSDSPRYPHPLRRALPANHYTQQYHETQWVEAMELLIRADSGELKLVVPSGRRTSLEEIILNTALDAGDDTLKLAARVDGQCEIHGFVEGRNRQWLAVIIENSLNRGLFNEGAGWEDVVRLLTSPCDGAVVLSASCCESFPNQGTAEEGGWKGHESAWDRLKNKTRWNRAVKGLRTQEERGYGKELKPDNWKEFRFQKDVSLTDILN